MGENIFRSEELFDEFNKIYGDDGKINELVKECKEEIEKPFERKSFIIQNYTYETKSNENKKVSNAKINNIDDTKNLIKNMKNTIEIAGKTKVSKSNLNFADKCHKEWGKLGNKDGDDEESEELNLEDYNFSDLEKSSSIFDFYRELGELTAITKTLTQNHADSTKFQCLSDFYQSNDGS